MTLNTIISFLILAISESIFLLIRFLVTHKTVLPSENLTTVVYNTATALFLPSLVGFTSNDLLMGSPFGSPMFLVMGLGQTLMRQKVLSPTWIIILSPHISFFLFAITFP